MNDENIMYCVNDIFICMGMLHYLFYTIEISYYCFLGVKYIKIILISSLIELIMRLNICVNMTTYIRSIMLHFKIIYFNFEH